jgi:antitoxin (DNA-binding transcriptional repressor) of toxin-antitoxin stability system
MINGMIVTTEIGVGELAELVKHVQAGNEVLLTQSNKPVAKLVSASEKATSPGVPLRIRALKGHRVLTPIISQGELAEEMFGRR